MAGDDDIPRLRSRCLVTRSFHGQSDDLNIQIVPIHEVNFFPSCTNPRACPQTRKVLEAHNQLTARGQYQSGRDEPESMVVEEEVRMNLALQRRQGRASR